MDVFEKIYQVNGWNGVESRSGPGSGYNATHRMVKELKAIVQNLPHTREVLDVGCGDCNWQPYFSRYTGVDVSPTAIALAEKNPKNTGKKFLVMDTLSEPLPKADLVICRDVLQHLSFDSGLKLLSNIVNNAKPNWMILSSYTHDRANEDIPDGWYTSPNLEIEPYNLGEPLYWIFDGWDYDQHYTEVKRDPHKWLGIWSLP